MAVTLDPFVLGLGVFAANEYASAQRSAGPPVACGQADNNLQGQGNEKMLKVSQHILLQTNA